MTLEDLLTSKYEPTSYQLANLKVLLPKLVDLEQAFQSKLVVNSAYRSWADHLRIYQKINDQRVILGKSEVPIPLHSAHLSGNAADISDPEKDLQSFLADEKFLKDNGLWAESFAATHNWVHVQNIAYRSWVPGATRFFKPF